MGLASPALLAARRTIRPAPAGPNAGPIRSGRWSLIAFADRAVDRPGWSAAQRERREQMLQMVFFVTCRPWLYAEASANVATN